LYERPARAYTCGKWNFCRKVFYLSNLMTLLLGITIAFTLKAESFLTADTLKIPGLFAFILDTVGGFLFTKFINLFLKKKINPMIGAAGISAFPMTSRLIQKLALKEDPGNIFLMHAVSADVSGQIASVAASGLALSLVTRCLWRRYPKMDHAVLKNHDFVTRYNDGHCQNYQGKGIGARRLSKSRLGCRYDGNNTSGAA
jgi:hypothetical protein